MHRLVDYTCFKENVSGKLNQLQDQRRFVLVHCSHKFFTLAKTSPSCRITLHDANIVQYLMNMLWENYSEHKVTLEIVAEFVCSECKDGFFTALLRKVGQKITTHAMYFDLFASKNETIDEGYIRQLSWWIEGGSAESKFGWVPQYSSTTLTFRRWNTGVSNSRICWVRVL
jgi:hypothetical protein